MKKFVALIVAIIVLYSVYYDLKIGTIPAATHASEVKTPQETTAKPTVPFQLKEVEPGETVLTIVEQLEKGPLSVPINKVIHDFQKLNNGIKPEEIQIGQEYKFPVYKKR
ncbi:hypothetical protein AN964_08495 [Heyndrickxia shackletonii]|uniref:LysM domain-containing protein n=1 Tax=Heyndrickxia shackletonii TaxID=157838 RepID=A0A0Q3WW46_9BACI|nr:hypothetical protein [Heyndrickxia shackletonii]KQL53530.1 hypothetical protein AN964_08495 [Heyndrickxia shackletonii]MBB2480120.1 hypothetical protein [Bacillus sp. APMAM]NEY99609.1 hypothetical protein [Heyndrickxia shackletonii]RTZ56488.1 hypothetical protein EKO25_07595 [Bacillus sp. SAJ1]